MNLRNYDFSKNVDRRAAIDLLNYLIADCMVSEGYIRVFAKMDEWIKNPSEEMLKNKADELMEHREKAIRHWLSCHFMLHRAIEEDELSDSTEASFNLFYGLFDLNKRKLHKFLSGKKEEGGVPPSMRKEEYGLAHYFNKRSLSDALRKAAKERVIRND